MIKFFIACAFVFCVYFEAFADIYNSSDISNISNREEHSKTKNKYLSYPRAEVKLINEIFLDEVTRDASSGGRGSNYVSYTFIRPMFSLRLHKNFSFNTNFSIEDVATQYRAPYTIANYSQSNSNDRDYFNGQGLIAEEVNFQFEKDTFRLNIGKFNPVFGAGAKRYSKNFDNDWYGVSGTNLNFGYELREKSGVKIENDFVFPKNVKYNESSEDEEFEDSDRKLLLTFSASFYTNDRSTFYSTEFASRNNQAYFNNTSGSATGLRSYSVSFDGYLKDRSQTLSYNISTRAQHSSSPNESTETGNVISLQYVIKPVEYFKYGVFGEYAIIKNAYSVKDNNQFYRTASFFTGYSGFVASYVVNSFSSSGSLQSISQISNFAGLSVNSKEASLGYDFSTGIGVRLARKFMEISGFESSSNSGFSKSNLAFNSVSVRYAINY